VKEVYPIIRYDKEHDVLYIHFRPITEYTDDEVIAQGAIARIGGHSRRLLSLVILDYAKEYRVEVREDNE